MKSGINGRITAWSLSRWRDYEECPRKAGYKHVMRMKEPDKPAFAKGNRIHASLENFVAGRSSSLAPEVDAALRPNLRALREADGVKTEDQWAFSQSWAPVDWFSPSAWVRMKMDLHVVDGPGHLLVVDYKSGKVARDKEYSMRQLELYAVGGFLMYPEVTEVTGQLVYVEHNVVEPGVFGRKDLRGLQKAWVGRTKRMLTDTRFDPRPSTACKWCHFSRTNGGPCEF